MSPNRRRLAIVRRRGWVIVLAVVLAVSGAYLYVNHKAAQYSASAYVLVSSGATATGPGSANEASALATTYAGLIPKDNAIIGSVSRALRESTSSVRSSIAVFTSNSTAILEIRYTSGSRTEAIEGARAVAQDLIGPVPVTTAIPAGSILLASLPTSASFSGSSSSTAFVLGSLLGLLLGLAIMLTWERFDPRVDSGNDLADLLGVPVTMTMELSPAMSRALRERWSALTLGGMPFPPVTTPAIGAMRVALIGLASSSAETAESVARALAERADDETEQPFKAGSTGRSQSSDVDLLALGDPRGDDGPLLVSVGADIVVLIVKLHEHARDVAEAERVMGSFGFKPSWAILANGWPQVPGPSGWRRWTGEPRRRRIRRHPVEASGADASLTGDEWSVIEDDGDHLPDSARGQPAPEAPNPGR